MKHKEEIRIGALYPLTGNRALLGQSIRQALELYVDFANHPAAAPPQLMLPQLEGRKVRLIWGDTKGDPILAQEEARRMIEEKKVSSIIGCYQSSVTQAVSFQMESSGIPFLSPDADASILTRRGFHWFFRTGPDSRVYTKALLKMLAQQKFSNTTLGALAEDSLLGQDEVQALLNLSPKCGHKVTVIELFEVLTKERLYPIHTADPDMLVIPQGEEDAISAIQHLKSLGYCPLAYLDQTGFFALEELLKSAGEDANHVISTAAWAVSLTRKLPLAKSVNRLYRARYGENMNSVNALSFTGIYVLVDAIARAHSTKPQDIKRALMDTAIPGSKLTLPWSGIAFNKTGQNVFADSMVVQVLDKTNQIIWPKELAEAKAVIPAYPCC